MIDYYRMLPLEKARAAEEILNNPVFNHIINDEISACTRVAIHGDVPDEREANRQAVIWVNNLLKRLRDHVKLRIASDAARSSS